MASLDMATICKPVCIQGLKMLYPCHQPKLYSLHDANLLCSDEPWAKPVKALESTPIGLISGGWRHTIAADKSGKLYAWGWNKVGILSSNAVPTASAQPLCT